MSMDRLPDELLLMIFRRIDDFREKLKLERVCRRWRKIMRDHGWKHLRQVVNRLSHHGLTPHKWVVPFSERCGNRLIECSFYSLNIDSNLMRLIAENLRALRHLGFHSCQMYSLDANVLNPFPEFGARLRSLSLFTMDYRPQLGLNLLRHFPHLRHLGLDFSFVDNRNYINDICRHFSAHLCSLYLDCSESNSLNLDQMLARVQINSPELMTLYLDTAIIRESALLRISELKSLRFLNIDLISHFNSNLLSSCLANLPHLRAFHIGLGIQQFSDVLRSSSSFHGLVHLQLSLFDAHPSDNFEPIGLLATFAPQLRSFNLDIHAQDSVELDEFHGIECQLLKMANNGKLEHLNMPSISFTTAEMDQLIRLCPNLHSLCAHTSSPWQPLSESEVAELRNVVADQWHAGTRKQLPLRIWIHGLKDRKMFAQVWQDPFLVVRHVNSHFLPPLNPVLETLFRDEVFNGNDDGGTPSFVTNYGVQGGPRVATNDLVIF